MILTFLPESSLRVAETVSSKWHAVASSTYMWRNRFLTDYGRSARLALLMPSPVGGPGTGKAGVANQQWKKMYKARRDLECNWSAGTAGATYLQGHTDSVYCVQFDEYVISPASSIPLTLLTFLLQG